MALAYNRREWKGLAESKNKQKRIECSHRRFHHFCTSFSSKPDLELNANVMLLLIV